jgi:hypothetical protein
MRKPLATFALVAACLFAGAPLASAEDTGVPTTGPGMATAKIVKATGEAYKNSLLLTWNQDAAEGIGNATGVATDGSLESVQDLPGGNLVGAAPGLGAAGLGH